METVSAIFDTIGLFLLGVATVFAADFLRTVAGWRRDSEVTALKRRLADVEALRRGPPDVEAMRSALAFAGELFRAYEREHLGKWRDAATPQIAASIMEKAKRNGSAADRCFAAILPREPMDPEAATRTIADDPWGPVLPGLRDHIKDQFLAARARADDAQGREWTPESFADRPRHAPLPESRTPADSRADALAPLRRSQPNSIVARHLGTRPICAETEGDCS